MRPAVTTKSWEEKKKKKKTKRKKKRENLGRSCVAAFLFFDAAAFAQIPKYEKALHTFELQNFEMLQNQDGKRPRSTESIESIAKRTKTKTTPPESTTAIKEDVRSAVWKVMENLKSFETEKDLKSFHDNLSTVLLPVISGRIRKITEGETLTPNPTPFWGMYNLVFRMKTIGELVDFETTLKNIVFPVIENDIRKRQQKRKQQTPPAPPNAAVCICPQHAPGTQTVASTPLWTIA